MSKNMKPVVPIFLASVSAAALALLPLHARAQCPSGGGMVSYWTFDAGDATDDHDANDGAVHGATAAQGRTGQAFHFDGEDDYIEVPHATSLNLAGPEPVYDYVEVPHSPSLDLAGPEPVHDYVEVPHSPSLDLAGGQFTFETWIKIRGYAGDFRTIIGKIGWTDTSLWSYNFQVRSDGGLYVDFVNTGGTRFPLSSHTESLRTGIWHHVAATYDGGMLRLYIDGDEVASREAYGVPRANDYPLSIGRWWSDDPNQFQGMIDEAAVYDRALAASEVLSHYEAGSAGYCVGGCPAGMVSHWSFDEADGATAYDSIGVNDGTIYGAVRAAGKVNGALDLPGRQFTFEAWIDIRGYAGDFRTIIGKIGWTDTSQWSYNFQVRPDGGLYADFVNGAGTRFPLSSHTESLRTDVWQHVAATYDGGMLRLYIDGAEVAAREAYGDPRPNEYPLSIGRWWSDDPNQFQGMIDEAAVYSRALAASEVLSHYEAGAAGYCDGGCPAGMVSYWRFDEAGGATAHDSVGGNDGTVHGAVRTASKANGALDLPGRQFALEAWINVKEYAGDYGAIVGKIGWSDTSQWSYNMHVRSDGGLHASFVNANGTQFPLSSPSDLIQAGAWHHVAAAYDGAMLRMYIDGAEVAAREAYGDPRPNEYPLSIGRWHSGDPNWFSGAIDDVALHSRALTPAEIREHHDKGSLSKGYCWACAADAECDDGNPCTKDLCAGGTCVADPAAMNGAPCDDGTLCTAGDICANGSCAGAAVPGAEGLRSYWTFDAGDAADVYGGNDGTVHGAAGAQGRTGQAFSFDGEDDYIEVPHAADLNLGGPEAVADRVEVPHAPSLDLGGPEPVSDYVEVPYSPSLDLGGPEPVNDYVEVPHAPSLDLAGGQFTLEAWVNVRAYAGDFRTIMAKMGWTHTTGWSYNMRVRDNGGLYVDFVNDNGTRFPLSSPAGLLQTGVWHHVAAAYDGGMLRLYVDGAEAASREAYGSLRQNDYPLSIGRLRSGDPDQFLGMIDEAAVYDRALAAQEVQSHYAAGSAGYCTGGCPGGMVSLWSFDEGDGSVAYDSIGGNHGAIYGASRSAGMVNGALDFPGEQFTLEAWINVRGYAGDFRTIMAKMGWDHTSWWSYNMQVRDNGGLYADFVNEAGTRFPLSSPSGLLQIGAWHHVAAAYDGGMLRLYVDGAEAASREAYGSPRPNDYPLSIGRLRSGDANQFLGKIDEAAVYDRALAAEEVLSHYEAGSAGYCDGGCPAGMVSLWSFDEGDGAVVYDSIGGNHGTVSGAVRTSGMVGGALDFPGKQFTLESWINVTRYDGDERTILAKMGWTHTSWWSYNMQVRSYGALYADFFNENGTRFPLSSPSGSIRTGAWQHVAATYDGAVLRLYIDGAEAASREAYGDLRRNDYPLSIGRLRSGDPNTFSGLIDEVAVYDRALAPEELLSHYEAGAAGYCDGGCPAGMVSLWSFDEGGGAAAYDSVGGNHGTISGAVRTAGMVGGALDFPGRQFAMEAWINPAEYADDYRAIIGKVGWTDTSRWSYNFHVRYDGGLHANFANDNNATFSLTSAPGSIQTGVWQHVAATYDHGMLRLYIDGAEAASREAYGGPRPSDYPVSIGRWQSADPNPFAGLIDEAAVFGRSLTPAEVQKHYDKGLIGKGLCEALCTDADGDGYGAAGSDTSGCAEPGYDCDDGDGAVIPGSIIETDIYGSGDIGECRTRIEECLGASGALQTIRAAVGPSVEACDGLDNDCDAAADEDFPDFDGDAAADCVDPDDDGDGLADEDDGCPYENPGAQDANGDGCADRLEDAPRVVEELSLPGGTANEITSKLETAIAAQNEGKTEPAVNKLRALINSVQAQRGKKISAEDADLLIEFANNAISGME
ncbi:MAG: LamG domain-containing protein [Elusimicrobiota bacterium]